MQRHASGDAGRHDEWFARLLGADDPYGWDEKGPDFRAAASFASRTKDAPD